MGDEARRERLARALRANLRRRKGNGSGEAPVVPDAEDRADAPHLRPADQPAD